MFSSLPLLTSTFVLERFRPSWHHLLHAHIIVGVRPKLAWLCRFLGVLFRAFVLVVLHVALHRFLPDVAHRIENYIHERMVQFGVVAFTLLVVFSSGWAAGCAALHVFSSSYAPLAQNRRQNSTTLTIEISSVLRILRWLSSSLVRLTPPRSGSAKVRRRSHRLYNVVVCGNPLRGPLQTLHDRPLVACSSLSVDDPHICS